MLVRVERGVFRTEGCSSDATAAFSQHVDNLEGEVPALSDISAEAFFLDQPRHIVTVELLPESLLIGQPAAKFSALELLLEARLAVAKDEAVHLGLHSRKFCCSREKSNEILRVGGFLRKIDETVEQLEHLGGETLDVVLVRDKEEL